MKENEKKVLIIVMNILAILGNVMTIVLIAVSKILSMYFQEFSNVFQNLENVNFSIIATSIRMLMCIVFGIIIILLSSNMKKNESKISFLMAISMLLGSLYNVIAGFVSLIIIYKRKKRRKCK